MEHQKWNTVMVQNDGRYLAFRGDGRADIPGHSAKCGSYGMFELQAICVIDVQLYRTTNVVEAMTWKRKVSQPILFHRMQPDHEHPRHKPPLTYCSMAG